MCCRQKTKYFFLSLCLPVNPLHLQTLLMEISRQSTGEGSRFPTSSARGYAVARTVRYWERPSIKEAYHESIGKFVVLSRVSIPRFGLPSKLIQLKLLHHGFQDCWGDRRKSPSACQLLDYHQGCDNWKSDSSFDSLRKE